MTRHDPNLDILLRDPAAIAVPLVYGVTSTKIYCRPGCPARKPKPENIRFFADAAAARAGGFRACLRCKPDAAPQDAQATAVMRACRAIDRHLADGAEGPPRLDDLAAASGLSMFHLQKVFVKMLGVSPRDFAEARRLALFKRGLRDGNGVADAGYAAGYGSSSRVHARTGDGLGMTPATYARGGKGAVLLYAAARCALGRIMVAATKRGVAALYLGDSDAALLAELRDEFPEAELKPDADKLHRYLPAIVAAVDGGAPLPLSLPLDVRATSFQLQVRHALRRIPAGETRSYAEIAAELGVPKGQRAVGRACATNPVSLLIPCHRALRSDGGLGGYRWGLARKQKLLEREKA
jgi:AraC family transcriptional regulator of adaptative response/methylated-DNA-[protein]-cysteine methyltransferase